MLLSAQPVLDGVEADWIWQTPGNALPAGVLIHHDGHLLQVPWVVLEGESGPVFTLEALVPLTVVEPIVCGRCGLSGLIGGGVWLPTEGGVARG